MQNSDSHSAPRLLFIAARRGIGAGALAAACAARIARDGQKTALADLRQNPHPAIAANSGVQPPFRLAKPGEQPPFAPNEISIALSSHPTHPSPPAPPTHADAPDDDPPPNAAAVVFTYAERDLVAARLAADQLRKTGADFACVAVHTPPQFPFLPQLRNRAAKALGDARVIEAPEFLPDRLVAGAFAGQPCEDPALAQTIDKLAKLADDDERPNLPEGVNLGEAVAAVRRELADVI